MCIYTCPARSTCMISIFTVGHIVITPCSVYMCTSLQKGETALIKASLKGDKEWIQFLLIKGADINCADNMSAIIVCLACSLV